MESMRTQKKYLVLVFVILGLCLGAALPLSAQRRQGQRIARATQTARDPLVSLRQVLNKAGATALSSAQEQQLNDLITMFKSERKAQGQDSALQSARKNYETAILTGDVANATNAADELAKLLSTRLSARLEANASFRAKAYTVLQSDQVSALESSIGKDGLLRVLRSLIITAPRYITLI
jgi:hypothetical protein